MMANQRKLLVRLVGKNGEIYAETTTQSITANWKKYNATLTAKTTIADASLEIIPQMTGTLDLDLISLFPQKTFQRA